MKYLYKSGPLLILLILFSATHSKAQTFDNAGSYMSFIGSQYRLLMEDYMSYTSAVAHGKTARKIENKRKELITTANDIIRKISVLPPYTGDKTLRDSSVKFLKIAYSILNEDYAKIVNMEEVAEQSYDAMEAYFLAQDLANEKLKSASVALDKSEKIFIEKYKITISDQKDELGEKVEIAGRVNSYQRIVYLIFFKSYKQEFYMMDALNKKDLNAYEQNKNTLLKYATEGLSKLDTMKAFNNDKSLIETCRQMLQFYKKECQNSAPIISNYLLKEEDFKKIKKVFESKKEGERTKEDVDKYNKSVNEMNESLVGYNATNATLNSDRNKFIGNWNKSSQDFLDKHTPKYKK